MTRSKKWGVCFLAAPFLGLIVVLGAWAVISFVIGQMITVEPVAYNASPAVNGSVAATIALGESDARATAANIINVVLGLIGLLCVVMIPVGLVVGIVLLAKKDAPQVSEKASESPLPPPVTTDEAQNQDVVKDEQPPQV